MIEAPQHPDLAALEQRYAVFVDKLIARGAELVTTALPQIQQLMSNPTASGTGAVDQLKVTINRQLASLNDKAYQVYNDEIMQQGTAYPSDSFYTFRDACYGRFAGLEAWTRQWRDMIDEAARPDYEAELRRIQGEFEATKSFYRCPQCGAALPVDRMFFVDLYITCPQCGTRNHIAPPPAARRLDFIVRPLAERRHADKLTASHLPRQQVALLANQWVANIGRAEDGDQAAKVALQQICQQMFALNAQAEQLVRGYLNAVYTDMAELVPTQVAHFQQQYQQDVKIYLAGIVDDRARIDMMTQRTENSLRLGQRDIPSGRGTDDIGE